MKRLNIVTLGVVDLTQSRGFYEELFGWEPRGNEEQISFYNMGGWMIALYPRELLAEDAQVPPEGSGFSGITLAHNVERKDEVSIFLEKAKGLGATVVKEAQDVFWGGHSGYFKDQSGHLWEVAFNPFTKTLADGTLDIPKI